MSSNSFATQLQTQIPSVLKPSSDYTIGLHDYHCSSVLDELINSSIHQQTIYFLKKALSQNSRHYSAARVNFFTSPSMTLRSSLTSCVMLLKCLVTPQTPQAQMQNKFFTALWFFSSSGSEVPWAVIFDKCSLYHFIIRNCVVCFQSRTSPDMVPPAVSASSALDGHILHV